MLIGLVAISLSFCPLPHWTVFFTLCKFIHYSTMKCGLHGLTLSVTLIGLQASNCTLCLSGAFRGQKRTSDTLDRCCRSWESQSSCWELNCSFAGTVSTFTQWVISTALGIPWSLVYNHFFNAMHSVDKFMAVASHPSHT